MERWPVAIGVLPGTDGAWVGVQREDDGFRVVYGSGEAPGLHPSPTEQAERREELLTAAVAYFEEALGEPPQELQAMQADLADVVRWLAATEADASRRRSLTAAVDAIDDGLAGDTVVSRLNEARADVAGTKEQADAVDLLLKRYRALLVKGG